MKKRRDFLPPNKTKLWHLFLSFLGTAVELCGPTKKSRDFLLPNKTKLWHLFLSFSGTAVELRGPIKRKEESPPRLIRQKNGRGSLRRIKCAAI